jgi:hypothetical protein
VTRYTEGFSHFVTSMAAPVASGWSVRRVGLAPTGKRRLLTAHANSSHSPMVGDGTNIAQTKRVSLDELDLKTDRWEFVTYFGMQASELDTTIAFISLSCIVS